MIQITDKIRISRLDNLTLQIEELCEVKSQKTKEIRKEWKWKGYYGTLRSAISGVLKYYLTELCDEDIADLKHLAERIDEIDKQLQGAIKDEN